MACRIGVRDHDPADLIEAKSDKQIMPFDLPQLVLRSDQYCAPAADRAAHKCRSQPTFRQASRQCQTDCSEAKPANDRTA